MLISCWSAKGGSGTTTVVAALARVQNLYEMTLAASGRLLGLSLLDYL